MRYVIMVQIVGVITLLLLGASAMFAWLQNRTVQPSLESENGYFIGLQHSADR